ncbi:MAG: hypothetical protein SGI92_22710 [Bryobacteraceae bacterium]|nr:hypothetical protein [Bryobacteraceae bacterium]
MKSFLKVLVLAALAVVSAIAQPRIGGLQNNYSYLVPGNPNYGIAQGSIFIISGTNLANSTTGLQNVPLQTTLNGVSARVTVNGTSTDVLWYYVTPGQLGGILPSRTPVGTGTITVTNNGQTSAAAQIQVVQSAFGILTLAGTGTGAAGVFDAQNRLLSTTGNATKPGDVIVIWGSGIGPAAGDETILQTQVNLPNIPVTVEIGGISAPVLYRGRTAFPGLDQINVTVPAGVTPGCDVSLLVKTGAISSNSTTIPVSATGGNCPATQPGGGGTGTPTISQADIDRWLAAGQFRSGSVTLSRSTTYASAAATPTRQDTLDAGFLRISGGDLQRALGQFAGQINQTTIGSCTVTQITLSAQNPFPGFTPTFLDAGATVDVRGPSGSKSAPRQRETVAGITFIGYNATVGNGTPGNYMDQGSYTFSNPGGPDVGIFNGSIQVGPELNWTNRSTITSVNRSQGVTVTWSGGDPNTNVEISGFNSSINLQTFSSTTVSFVCLAKNSDGRFTVPASVLTQLPASTSIPGLPPGTPGLGGGSLGISSSGPGIRLTATGIDYLLANYDYSVNQTVSYQ